MTWLDLFIKGFCDAMGFILKGFIFIFFLVIPVVLALHHHGAWLLLYFIDIPIINGLIYAFD